MDVVGQVTDIISRRSCPGAASRLLCAVAGAVMVFWPIASQAQTAPSLYTDPGYVHEQWTIADGLPVNSINDILQTRDGYLWVATFDGLVRFDGSRFTVFNSGNSEGLPSNRIVRLLEDRMGTIWLLTEQGHLVRFGSGRFTHFGPSHGFGDRRAWILYEDPDGTVWVGTDRGFGRIQGDRLELVAEDMIDTRVSALLADSGGVLWVGTWDAQVFRYEEGKVRPVPRPEASWGRAYSFYQDPAGAVWVATSSGAYRVDQLPETALDSPLAGLRTPVSQLVRSPETGLLWVAAAGGTYRVEAGGATLIATRPGALNMKERMQVDEDGAVWKAIGARLYRDGHLIARFGPDAEVVLTADIQSFYRDREGSIWIGTNADGLHRLKPALFGVYSEDAGITHRNIYPVLEDHLGFMWVGTWGGGLNRLSPDGTATGVNPAGENSNFVTALYLDRSDSLWVGYYGNGVLTCELPEMSCVRPDTSVPRYARVRAFHKDGAGRMWVGTDTRLLRRDSKGWTTLDGLPQGPQHAVRVFAETSDGALWMGTNGGGLFRFYDGTFESVTPRDGLPSDLIRSLYQDEDGWLWVGTEGRGLARIDLSDWDTAEPAIEARRIVSYRQTDGLFDEVIHQILEDDFGRLWMSTNRGIFWVERTELLAFADGSVSRIHSVGYTEREGLKNREANGGFQPAGVKAADGRLWFPTQDGVAVVDPANLIRNAVVPPVVLEEVRSGERVLTLGGDGFTLGTDERDVEFSYTALSLLAPENVRFRYRLDGYNEDWVEAGNRRTAFYTNVRPGEYTFRVIASNNDGVWNEEGAAVSLTVDPHFYETRTYYALLILVISLLGLGALRWRISSLERHRRELRELVETRTEQLREQQTQLATQNVQLEQQAVKLEEINRAKSRFFANISHEFRTPLTLTIGPLEDLRDRGADESEEKQSRYIDMALRNARRLLRLVNQILDVAKLESGEMKLQAYPQDLIAFARGVIAAFAPVARRKRIQLRFDAPLDPLILSFDPDALEKVLTNLLSNAFKFCTEDGTIALTISWQDHEDGTARASLSVADTGPGIPPDDLAHVFERFYQTSDSEERLQPGTGIGLSLVKELVELHGGSVEAESSSGEGAKFTVILPLDESVQETVAYTGDAEDVEEAVPTGPVGVPEAEPAEDELDSDDAELYRDDEESRREDVVTVLVVDDSEDIRTYIRSRFEPRYRVAEAGDGSEGLERARTLLPDLVISDVVMPGMDGYELCQALRASPETDFIPIILLTAKAETADMVAGLEQGADAYVVKPFEMQELEAKSANLIESRRRLRDRFGSHGLELRAGVVPINSADADYLERVRQAIEENLADGEFGVAQLARAVSQDRSHLYRRIRELLDETPSELIRRLRLERSAQLLAGNAGSVAEIGYACGFNSVSYFCKCFREHHQMTATEFRSAQPASQ
ncbi:MAG: two-component regulator propeller domain-containing protein [Gemmatimonadota bacterium]